MVTGNLISLKHIVSVDETKYIYETITLSDYNLIATRYKKLLVRYHIKNRSTQLLLIPPGRTCNSEVSVEARRSAKLASPSAYFSLGKD